MFDPVLFPCVVDESSFGFSTGAYVGVGVGSGEADRAAVPVIRARVRGVGQREESKPLSSTVEHDTDLRMAACQSQHQGAHLGPAQTET